MKRRTMKPETVKREVERMEKDLDLLESGRGSCQPLVVIERISDKIVWLRKFRHIDEKTMHRLCDRVIEVNEAVKHFL